MFHSLSGKLVHKFIFISSNHLLLFIFFIYRTSAPNNSTELISFISSLAALPYLLVATSYKFQCDGSTRSFYFQFLFLFIFSFLHFPSFPNGFISSLHLSSLPYLYLLSLNNYQFFFVDSYFLIFILYLYLPRRILMHFLTCLR